MNIGSKILIDMYLRIEMSNVQVRRDGV